MSAVQPTAPAERLRLLLVAALTAGAMVVATGYYAGAYLGLVTDDLRAVARLTTTGDSLGVSSDVKFRGLRVGRVLTVRSGEEPEAEIVVMAEHADEIPSDVVARVLPSTLFGNEYVELVPGGAAAGGRASTGSPTATGSLEEDAVIPADTSTATTRLMDVLADTQRVLVSIDPDRLDTAISAVSDAMRGKGDDLARLTRDADTLLADWNRLDPAVARDMTLLADNLETLADIEPELVRTVHDMLPVATTVARQQRDLATALRDGRRLLRGVNDFTEEYGDELLRVLSSTAATLGVFAGRSASFHDIVRLAVDTVRNGATAIEGNRIQMEASITNDFLEPYSHRDCPRYGAMAGPNCGGGR